MLVALFCSMLIFSAESDDFDMIEQAYRIFIDSELVWGPVGQGVIPRELGISEDFTELLWFDLQLTLGLTDLMMKKHDEAAKRLLLIVGRIRVLAAEQSNKGAA